jgi:hypothetical protein
MFVRGLLGRFMTSTSNAPLLARLILEAMWGVDPRPFYRSLASVSELPDGATVLDVPCGGGVALRGLHPSLRRLGGVQRARTLTD